MFYLRFGALAALNWPSRKATWNLSGGRPSAQAPAAWVQADQRNQLYVFRMFTMCCGVVIKNAIVPRHASIQHMTFLHML